MVGKFLANDLVGDCYQTDAVSGSRFEAKSVSEPFFFSVDKYYLERHKSFNVVIIKYCSHKLTQHSSVT
jgi:hypothetical protein